MIYVVLGMHKSGTTLVSQTLHHSGIHMGDNIDVSVAYDKGNQYERASSLRLNQSILECGDALSIDIEAPQQLAMSLEQRGQMQEIIRDCSLAYQDWGFKDPRTCLTYPLWAEELPAHKIIAVYRSVDELWKRYRPRKLTGRYRDFTVALKLVQRWSESNLGVLNALEQTPMASIVMEFRDLMNRREEFDRFQEFVGRELLDRRRMELYRGRAVRSLPLDLAKWFVKQRLGMDTDQIAGQLDRYRKQLAHV